MGGARNACCAALTLLGIIACGAKQDSGAQDGGVVASPFTEEAMRAASIRFETKVCEAMQRCDGALLARTYGTLAACIGADRPFSELAVRYGFGSLLTPDLLTGCADALDVSTCEAYGRYRHEQILPEACRALHYGSLPNDAPCSEWNQCESGRCYTPVDGAPGSCGRCVAQQPIGARCQYKYGCVPGAICLGRQATTMVCKKFVDRGYACDVQATPCHPELACIGGTCVLPRDGECDPASGCNVMPSLRECVSKTRKCEDLPLARIGEPCGPINYFASELVGRTGTATECVYGATCKRQPTAPGQPPTYVCAPRVPLGGACNPADHPLDTPCVKGVCVQNLCQINGPAQCSRGATPP